MRLPLSAPWTAASSASPRLAPPLLSAGAARRWGSKNRRSLARAAAAAAGGAGGRCGSDPRKGFARPTVRGCEAVSAGGGAGARGVRAGLVGGAPGARCKEASFWQPAGGGLNSGMALAALCVSYKERGGCMFIFCKGDPELLSVDSRSNRSLSPPPPQLHPCRNCTGSPDLQAGSSLLGGHGKMGSRQCVRVLSPLPPPAKGRTASVCVVLPPPPSPQTQSSLF